jgi:hypothetical protein
VALLCARRAGPAILVTVAIELLFLGFGAISITNAA